MLRGQFCGQRVNRQIGLRRDPALHPAFYTGQFAAPGISLRFRRERAGLALEPHHVVDELDRNTQPPRSLGNRFLASAGVVWTPNDTWALRGLFSQGYNYPTLNQLFTQTTAGGQLTLPNPDLKPETANNFELGARFDNGATVLDATLFYTDAKDYIVRQGLPPVGGPPRAQYQNVDGAKTTGFEVYAEHDLGNGLTPYVSGAIIDRELNYGNGFSTSDSGTPSLAGTIGLRKDFDFRGIPASFDLFATGESSAKLRDDTGAVTSSAGGWTTVKRRVPGHLLVQPDQKRPALAEC